MRTKLIFAGLVAVVALTACTGAVDKMKNEYIEACAEGNFSEARKIVEKMAAEDISSYDLNEHWEYVNDKEIYALLEDGSKDASNRIVYLYNTYEYGQLPDMDDVLEVAISQKNEYLAGKLIKAGVKPRFNHANAAAMAEMPEILEQIVKGDPSVLTESKVADYYIEENGKEAYENMLIASLSNIEEQRIDAMLYKFERIATDRGLDNLTAKIAARNAEALYDEFKALSGKSVPRRPSLGMVQSDHYGELPSEYKEYSQAVTSYNSECTEMLSRAIAVKDWSLANKIIGLMKPNLEWNNLGDWEDVVTHSGNSSVYNAFKVSQNNTEDIDAARKMLNEAKKQ